MLKNAKKRDIRRNVTIVFKLMSEIFICYGKKCEADEYNKEENIFLIEGLRLNKNYKLLEIKWMNEYNI